MEEPEKVDDVIRWWFDNFSRYGVLSEAATAILSMPASSASVERAFSLSQQILRSSRTRMDDDLLAIFVKGKYNRSILSYLELIFFISILFQNI